MDKPLTLYEAFPVCRGVKHWTSAESRRVTTHGDIPCCYPGVKPIETNWP